MCDTLYIIAYHGNDPEAKAKRLDNHNNQIDWWLKYDAKLNIRILAQSYEDTDYYKHDRVTYISIDEPVPPAQARNILLDEFYSSDEEWAIFADSDAILNLHPNFKHTHINICQIMRDYPSNFNHIDLFWPHWDGRPGDGAFYDKFNNVDKDYRHVDWDNELRFDRKFGSMKGTLFFLRNNEKCIMMDTSFGFDNGKLVPGEDDEFAINMLMNGYGTYILRNIMLKEFTAPSTHAGAQNTRKEEMNKGDGIIRKKHGLPADRAKWYKRTKENGHGKQAVIEVPYTKDNWINPCFDGLQERTLNHIKPFTDKVKFYYFKDRERAKFTFRVTDDFAITYIIDKENMDKLVEGWTEDVNVKGFGANIFVGIKNDGNQKFVRFSSMAEFGTEHRLTINEMRFLCSEYERQQHEPQPWDK